MARTRTIWLACLLLLVTACGEQQQVFRLTGETMGTTYNIVAVDRAGHIELKDLQTAVGNTLARVNQQMSNWDPSSEISRFNQTRSTDPTPISSELYAVMSAANEVHRDSMGQFDVTLGPLIELWGFGARTPETPVPSDAEIAATLAQVGQETVLELTDQPPALRKARPDASVYLAAIAKGYGVDQLALTLASFGLTDYMVEIGGDLVAAGQNPDGEAWRIGIERPVIAPRSVQEIVTVSGLGMATSGDYRNYFEQDGTRYTHIIDAETGRPITHRTASVTVLAESAMLADAWATALLVLGQERGLALSEQHNLAALFIARAEPPNDSEADETGPHFKATANSYFEALQATN
ncbi:MAG: FAD:protein FMN transferase [Alphaproteobacteria bacterium]|nr:FAD:protein FMN transferase [Alphaproteobacteria bacterium SS10]